MKKKETEPVIGFKLVKITTEQFAIIEESYTKEATIHLRTNLEFGIDKEKRVIVVMPTFDFFTKDNLFMKIKTGCHFVIKDDAWSIMIDENENEIKLPIKLIRHLCVITIGTTRGILHSKTENTEYNKYFIPTINVEEMIKEDVIIAIKDHE